MNQTFLLYKLLEEIEDCIQYDHETGEVIDFDDAKFEELNMQKEEKEEQVALLIKNLRAENEVIKKEKQRLEARMKSNEKTIESAIFCLNKSLDGDKISTARVKTHYHTSWKVVIENEALIPDEFFKTERTPMKDAIGTAIKNGIEVLGAKRVSSASLVIQ